VRDETRLASRSWADRVEVFRGDVLDPDSLRRAMDGMDAAYYLVHFHDVDSADAAERNRRAASNFGRAAAAAGLRLVIYLGSLPPVSGSPSSWVRQRIEAGVMLRREDVPVVEFRAGVVIGSGSLAFEMIRYVVERVPLLVAPAWVRTKVQPVSVRNVLQYLVRALEEPDCAGRIIQIGGEDILSYADMFRYYAEIRGLRRLMLTVPVPGVRLSALWLGIVTPIAGPVARRFLEGLTGDLVLTDDLARRLFNVRLIGYRESVRFALRRFVEDQVDTAWTDALHAGAGTADAVEKLASSEGAFVEQIEVETKVPAHALFSTICSIGGESGWPYANALWKIRGMIDFLLGGVGMRSARRSIRMLRVGDTLDFWRVEAIEPDRLLRLRAEMKVPGRAWLEYRLEGAEDGSTRIRQTALFEPRGLAGILYWYLFYIPHRFIFPGMVRQLIRRAGRNGLNGSSA
jgi:uncharacterized protein YbjT (DUF2867 family)